MGKETKVLGTESIEVAAAMHCFGEVGPILFDEENEVVCFWYLDEPLPQRLLQQIEDGTLEVNLAQFLQSLEYMQTRVREEQQMHLEYEALEQ